jgi:hypothetical protein
MEQTAQDRAALQHLAERLQGGHAYQTFAELRADLATYQDLRQQEAQRAQERQQEAQHQPDHICTARDPWNPATHGQGWIVHAEAQPIGPLRGDDVYATQEYHCRHCGERFDLRAADLSQDHDKREAIERPGTHKELTRERRQDQGWER